MRNFSKIVLSQTSAQIIGHANVKVTAFDAVKDVNVFHVLEGKRLAEA